MMRMMRRMAVGALLAAALPALAFVRETTTGNANTGTCLWWGGRSVTYKVNTSALTGNAASNNCADPMAAVQAGFDAWNAASTTGTDFTFQNGGSSNAIAVGKPANGENTVVFRYHLCSDLGQSCQLTHSCPSSLNCWDNPQNVIALTWTTSDSVTGQITDADIELFAWDGSKGFYFTCVDPPAGTCTENTGSNCTKVDIQAVVSHEAGHVLGLDHVCSPGEGAPYSSCPSGPAPIMSPSVGTLAQRAFAQDDIDGICTIYPKNAATKTCAPVEKPGATKGGCSSAGGAEILGLLAAAFAARRLRRRRS